MEPTLFELNSPDVVSDVLDGEAVIINLDTGMYFRAAGDACGVWSAIIDGADPSSAPEPARAELGAFVEKLTEHELVRTRSGDASGDSSGLPAFAAGSLVIESHADLQDLLALDPVHDVESTTGWPQQPTS